MLYRQLRNLTRNGEEKPNGDYCDALIALSVAYCDSVNTSDRDIDHLSELIYQYDKYGYDIGGKLALFHNLGYCWHKIGLDNRALYAFKKSIYYTLSFASNTRHTPTAYYFKKCTTYLYHSLINEQLNLSSPTTFNDPFDTPIKLLLDPKSRLFPQAYRDCLKVACFSSNVRLPYYRFDVHNSPYWVYDEKKQEDDKAEYLNSLMWAHYADSHKGICIKYRFSECLSQLFCENPNIVAFFEDVIYSNDDMEKYSVDVCKHIESKRNEIGLNEALLLKGKCWEYENELRLIYYDVNGNGNYATIDILGCIESIYFGTNCSSKDVETIHKIMQSKRFIRKDTRGNEIHEKIKFYRMEFDSKHFGQLIAVEIK